MSNNSVVTIGHDVEMFLFSAKSGLMLTAIGKIGGTKKQPLAVPQSKVGLRVQEDGVAVEINTTPMVVEGGHKFQTAWVSHVRQAIDELDAFVKSKNSDWDLYYPLDGHKFKPVDLKNPQAMTFGCDPDFLAYDYGTERLPPSAEMMGDLRCAGGHIHIGYDVEKIPRHALIQLVEAYVYYSYAHTDRQQHRRPYYGLPGLYRPKPYGVEYRTPSNFWLRFGSENFPAKVGRFTKALMGLSKQEAIDLWQGVEWNKVQHGIAYGEIDEDYSDNLSLKLNTLLKAAEGATADDLAFLGEELDDRDDEDYDGEPEF